MSALDVIYEMLRHLPVAVAAEDAVVRISHKGEVFDLVGGEPTVDNEVGTIVFKTSVD